MKSKRVKASLYNLSFSYLNTLLAIIYSIILVPLYLNFFSLSLYGAWLASGSVITLLGLFDMGMNLFFTQKLAIFFGDKQTDAFANYYKTGMVVSKIIFLFLLFVCSIVSLFITKIVDANPSDAFLLQVSFVLAGIASAFNLYYQNIAAALQATLETQKIVVHTTVGILLGTLATVVGLYAGLSLCSIPIGLILRNVYTTVALQRVKNRLWRLFHIPNGTTSTKSVITFVKDLLPVFFSRTLLAILRNNQLILIARFLGPEFSAVYSITSKLVTTIGALFMPLVSSMFASLSQLHGQRQTDSLYSTINLLNLTISILTISIVAPLFFVNPVFIKLWVGTKMYGGVALNILVILSLIASTQCNIFNLVILAFGQVKISSYGEVITGIIQFLGILLLINGFQVLAVPMAEIGALMLCRFPLLIFQFKKYFNISWIKSFFLLSKNYLAISVFILLACLVLSWNLDFTLVLFAVVIWSLLSFTFFWFNREWRNGIILIKNKVFSK